MDALRDLLLVASVLIHAWVGMRNVWMDYVKHTGVRLALQVATYCGSSAAPLGDADPSGGSGSGDREAHSTWWSSRGRRRPARRAQLSERG